MVDGKWEMGNGRDAGFVLFAISHLPFTISRYWVSCASTCELIRMFIRSRAFAM